MKACGQKLCFALARPFIRGSWISLQPVHYLRRKQPPELFGAKEEMPCFPYHFIITKWQPIRPPVREASSHHLKIDLPFVEWISRAPQIAERYRRAIGRTPGQPI